MNIENQVCSLELAKKLKELGVKQNSLFYYDEHNNLQCITETISDWGYTFGICNKDTAAFTIAELGEMLPTLILSQYPPSHLTEIKCRLRVDKGFCVRLDGHDEWAETEADARAKMLIYLIENNLIKVQP